jgi:hypothetical protein
LYAFDLIEHSLGTGVFAHACNVGAEVRRPASIAAQQERSEDWFFYYLPSSGNHIYVGESRASLLPDFHYRC